MAPRILCRSGRAERKTTGPMRGYFGIGVEKISKPMNVGNLFRSAHAFGASFVFTIAAHYTAREALSDTSRSGEHLPYYAFDNVAELMLPRGCRLVGVELTSDAVDLPSFHHPACAAYVLGPEKGSLSPELLSRCDEAVRIPTKFCVNVGVAGAIVMYDRIRARGRFPPRHMKEGDRPELVAGAKASDN